MSFNLNDMDSVITRGNYEEFFLLYIDNELPASHRALVEAFAKQHPDLGEELKLLSGTLLPEEPVSFDKASLLSDTMKLQASDEALLLYVDEELKPAQRSKVELDASLDPLYAAELQLLQRSKLDASEFVVHPNKKELYRREERRIPVLFMLKIAAAVVIVAGTGFYLNQQPAPSAPSFANTKTESPTSPKAYVAKENNAGTEAPSTIQQSNDETSSSLTSVAEAVNVNHNGKKQVTEVQPSKFTEGGTSTSQIAALSTNDLPDADVPVAQERTVARMTPPIEIEKQIKVAEPVTSAPAERNNNIVDIASNTPEEPKKGTLKSFFRKATRVLAKTAGLDRTTNEDEVLISAVAVRIK